MGSTLLLCSSLAQAQLPLYDEAGRSYQTGRWQFDAQTTYYQATANYTRSGGEYVTLPNGYSYSLLDFDFGARWVMKKNWALYASSRVSNAESKNTVDTRKDSSLTQLVLGSDFLVYQSQRWDLYPDLSLTVPFKRVDATGDTVINGEGTMDFTAKLIARANWGAFDPFAFAGFTYRDDDRSSLLPYGVGAELQFSSWRLGAELRGYQTVIHDKFENSPARREIVANRNGGALRYYTVDPSLLETNLWLRGNLTSTWALKLGGGTSLTGSAIAAGWNVFAGLSFSPQFRSGSTPLVTPYKDQRDANAPAFQEETNDGVDQNLFRRPEPPKPVAPPIQMEPEHIKPSAPPVAPPPVPTIQRQKKMQQELDQTEFQIELKTTKKKKKKR